MSTPLCSEDVTQPLPNDILVIRHWNITANPFTAQLATGEPRRRSHPNPKAEIGRRRSRQTSPRNFFVSLVFFVAKLSFRRRIATKNTKNAGDSLRDFTATVAPRMMDRQAIVAA
jgi:hypothetical protein